MNETQIILFTEIVELVVLDWPSREPNEGSLLWQNTHCHAHLPEPTATTDSAFVLANFWNLASSALEYSE